MPTSRPVLRWSLVALAAAGIAISWVLWMMLASDVWASSLCPTTAKVNCEEVINSPWGKWRGIPLSVLGLVYFGFLGLWYAAIGLANVPGRGWQLVPLIVNLIGAAISVRLIFVMGYELSVWCYWCVAAHTINALLLVGGFLAWPRTGAIEAHGEGPPVAAPAGPAYASEARVFGIMAPIAAPVESAFPSVARVFGVMAPAAFLVVAVAAVFFALQQNQVAQQAVARYDAIINDPDYVLWRHASQQVNSIAAQGVRPDDLTMGPSSAPHTVVVFSDFDCPHCAALHEFIPSLLTWYPGLLRVVYKNYPLCDSCNKTPALVGCRHKHACDAARAAEAVRRLGGTSSAFRYHDLLFANRNRLSMSTYQELAGAVAISADKLAAEMNRSEVLQRIIEDTMLASKWGVTGSGDVFLDGRRLEHWRLFYVNDRTRTNLEASRRLWARLLGVQAQATTSQARG